MLDNNPTPPPRPKAGSEEALLKVSTKEAAMIASNFLKFPDAQLAQLELDLAGMIDTPQAQRDAWWSWLMNAGKHAAHAAAPAPAWWKAAKQAAVRLAQDVRRAIANLFS